MRAFLESMAGTRLLGTRLPVSWKETPGGVMIRTAGADIVRKAIVDRSFWGMRLGAATPRIIPLRSRSEHECVSTVSSPKIREASREMMSTSLQSSRFSSMFHILMLPTTTRVTMSMSLRTPGCWAQALAMGRGHVETMQEAVRRGGQWREREDPPSYRTAWARTR